MMEWILGPVRFWGAYRRTRRQLAEIQTLGGRPVQTAAGWRLAK
jgi:hypothetical protein